MSKKDVQYIDLGLKTLIKTFKDTTSHTRVGIIGANSREGGSNAEIGLHHEFGTSKMEMRSFLRYPLTEKLNTYLRKAGAYKVETLKDIVTEGDLLSFWEKVGVTAESIVQEAFDTGGFGQWPETKHTNKTGQILVDTQQLRNSIASEVNKK